MNPEENKMATDFMAKMGENLWTPERISSDQKDQERNHQPQTVDPLEMKRTTAEIHQILMKVQTRIEEEVNTQKIRITTGLEEGSATTPT